MLALPRITGSSFWSSRYLLSEVERGNQDSRDHEPKVGALDQAAIRAQRTQDRSVL